MNLAIEHVRRMRGGSQPHLMRCDDGNYYVVKFQNNPQHKRILTSEFLATRLAARLGVCVPRVEVVEVCPELILYTSELVIQLPMGNMPCSAGKQCGSRFPGHPANLTVHDVMPNDLIHNVRNLSDFLGVFVFDKWTCNTDRRQVIFFREFGERVSDSGETMDRGRYQAMMIDQGACFNAGQWNFPDAPLRSIYEQKSVYQDVTGIDSFEPWIERLEQQITEEVLRDEALRIPPDWYDDDWPALQSLLERLYSRRLRVRELICTAHESNRNPFPNWKARVCYEGRV